MYTGHIGLSEVYFRYVVLLRFFGAYTPDSQSPDYRMICNGIKETWRLVADGRDEHFFAFMLDVRFINVAERIYNQETLDYFLSMMGEYVGDQKSDLFAQQYTAFRRGTGPYKLDRFVSIDNRPDVIKYKENNPWTDNNHYWTQISVRYSDNKNVMFLVDIARRYTKIMCGIEAVEGGFSAIKDIHRAKRGSLGPSKLHQLLYIYNNQKMLKRF